ncbi:MAG: hypothetical protein NT001_02745 [Candidatus Woesearchaeota archaeon]|nr:hypothetical protein [Candidatus Woesearchaeota archaeon]
MSARHSKKEVADYILEQIDSGQPAEKIKSYLLRYTSEELDEVFDDLLKQYEGRKTTTVSRAIEILYVLIFAIFIFWVGASSSSPGEAVLVGFSPTLIYIIISIILLERLKKTDIILTVLPLALVFLFFMLGNMGAASLFKDMEVGKLSILNLILSYMFLFIIRVYGHISMFNLSSWIEKGVEKLEEEAEEEKEEMQEKYAQAVQAKDMDIAIATISPPKPEEYIELKQEEDKESLKKSVESIESNCKALNAAIGRVYRRSNGCTNLMRELIEVKKEWYNEFNVLTKTGDKDRMAEVVDKIEKRLNYLFRTERDIFGNAPIKNIKRDPFGNSRIIDVIIMNDNDPVETYFENALSLCGKIREKLAKHQ